MSNNLSVGSRGDNDRRLYCNPVERGSNVCCMSSYKKVPHCPVGSVVERRQNENIENTRIFFYHEEGKQRTKEQTSALTKNTEKGWNTYKAHLFRILLANRTRIGAHECALRVYNECERVILLLSLPT